MSAYAILNCAITQGLSSSERLVYLYIVGRANGAGVCWPSIATICADLDLSRRTVISATMTLRKRGLLNVQPRYQDTNNYFVVNVAGLHDRPTYADSNSASRSERTPMPYDDEPPVQNSALLPETGVQEFALIPKPEVQNSALMGPEGCKNEHLTVQKRSLQSVQQESNKEGRTSLRSVRARARPALASNANWEAAFAEFYQLYPRHVAPDRAHKAFLTRMREGANPADIIAGVRVAILAFANRPPDRIPYPATWLNDGAWRDAEPDTFDPALRAAGFTPETYAQARHAQQQSFPLALTGGRQ